MVEKGTYSLDFESLSIIIDGHEFIRTEYKGIYECVDDYKIYGEEWAYDERNEDLCAYVKVPINSSIGTILYVCKWNNPERVNLWRNELCEKSTDKYTFELVECAYHESFRNGFMGGMPVL